MSIFGKTDLKVSGRGSAIYAIQVNNGKAWSISQLYYPLLPSDMSVFFRVRLFMPALSLHILIIIIITPIHSVKPLLNISYIQILSVPMTSTKYDFHADILHSSSKYYGALTVC